MGIFLDYWKMAFFNIRSNKVRAFLTMLGIIIGVSSVVAILSIGNGMSNFISGSLSSMAGSYFEVYTNGSKPITTRILDNTVEKFDSITGYSEVLAFKATAAGLKKEVEVKVESGNEMFKGKDSNEIIAGRYFDKSEYDLAKPVCVIDQNGAKEIFGREDVVGEFINMVAYGREFTAKVVGIRKSGSALQSMLFGGPKIKVEMPASFVNELFGMDPDSLYDVLLFVDDPENAVEMSVKAKQYIAAALNERGTDMVKSYELNSGIAQFSSILAGVTAFVMLVAAISLFVGGVGVMNIMLVSVTERTREIGIRKSLGAKTVSILWQFLIESGLISLTGGVIGIVLGYLFSFLISAIIKAAGSVTVLPEFNIVMILIVAVFSMGIGIFFGWYPAKKAAKMTPIDALRM